MYDGRAKRSIEGRKSRVHRKHCCWTEDQATCPVSIFGSQDLILELDDGRAWCVFHRPAEVSDRLGMSEESLRSALSEIILSQARQRHISLPGFQIDGDLQILRERILDNEAPTDWSAEVANLDLRGCRISGDLILPGFHRAVDIEAHNISVGGSVQIGGDYEACFGRINFESGTIINDLSIGASDSAHLPAEHEALSDNGAPAGLKTHTRRINLAKLKKARRVSIGNLIVNGTLNMTGARIDRSLQITDCVFDPNEGGHAIGFDNYVDNCLRDAVEIGDPLVDDDTTAIGSLVIDRSVVHGSITLNPTAAKNLQISRTVIDGIIETSGVPVAANAMVLDLDVGVGLTPAYAPRNSRKRVSAQHQYKLARFKRCFRVVRAAAHDVEQRARFLRRERSAVSALSGADRITRALWNAHEFFTSSGENWRYPVAVLGSLSALFVSLLLFVDPSMSLAQAVAVSATNSIAPFLSLQSIVERTNLIVVMLSVVQSALTAALLSSIFLSLRAKIED